MKESGPVAPLEQQCVYPGYWLIEGWDVNRIREHPHYGYWVATRFDEEFERPTLAKVRDEIRNRREAK